MKVFVTGGTGYLGRVLVPELLRRGHDLRLLVRPASAPPVADSSESSGSPFGACLADSPQPAPDDWPSVTPADARDTARFVDYFREASGLDP